MTLASVKALKFLYTTFITYLDVCFIFLVSLSSFQQWTPLHVAAECARIDIVGCLVAKGADINIKDNNRVIIYIIM